MQIEITPAELLTRYGKDERMRVQTTDPFNAETVLPALEGAITPTGLFFIRNNDMIPEIAPDDWALRIDGHVESPFTLTYQDLRRLPSTSFVAVLECSGNSRARFAEIGPEAEGVQWQNGAVSNAEWVGVSVRLLLERAGVRHGAVQVACIGADADRTTRGVEVGKLMDDAILAYAMNGESLPTLHGGPVRLMVPGWGGINSIKWIIGMTVLDHECDSKYNQQKYVLIDEHGQQRGKVRATSVKSIITNIETGARLRAGTQVVRGFAWSPDGGVTLVEMSADGGTTWQAANLLTDLGPYSWRQFEWLWNAMPGQHVLAARATDAAGNTQPLSVPHNHHGYLMNAIHTVSVSVER